MHPIISEDMERVRRIVEDECRMSGLRTFDGDGALISGWGKMLRPQLVVLAARLSGCPGDSHITCAAGLELLHNSTLVHDDIIDSAVLRRGRETVNALYGDNTAILAGNILAARSFSVIAGCGDARIFSAAAKCCEDINYGQLLELEYKGSLDCGIDTYFEIISHKTASLIETCLVAGGLAASAGDEALDLFREIGFRTGRLFQIADDVFDYLEDEKKTGKRRFQDVGEGKMTLPAVYFVQACAPDEKEFFRSLLGKPDVSGPDGGKLISMMERYRIFSRINGEYSAAHEEIGRLMDGMKENEYLPHFKALIENIAGRMYECTKGYL